MKRFAASILAFGLLLGGLLIAPQAAFAATAVSGTVTHTGGAPVAFASVYFYQNGNLLSSPTASTDTNGHFSLPSLAVGDYTVAFSAGGLGTEYRAITVGVDTPVVVDATLSPESTITGTIRDERGVGIGNAQVNVVAVDGSWTTRFPPTTAMDGTYTVVGLAAGSVKVLATAGGNYQGTWYTTGHNAATASPIAVPAAGAVDIILPDGAIIEGSVVDSIGSPIEFAQVTATGAGLDEPVSGLSNSHGTYSVQGLRPQVYSLIADEEPTDGENRYGLFAPSSPQTVTASLVSPATADFVLTPALVDESEFVDESVVLSGPTTVEPGGTYTWTVEHNGDLNVYAILYSSPVYLGAAVRNPDDSVTFTLTIPKATTPGSHKLTFSGLDENGEDTGVVREYLNLTVTGDVLPATGAAVAPLAAVATLLGGLGLLVLLFMRRAARR